MDATDQRQGSLPHGPDPTALRPGLRALWALGEEGDAQLQTLVDVVADLCDVPLAALSIFDGDDYHLPITAGVEPMVCDAQDSLCVHVLGSKETVVVDDVQADGRFAASPYVDGRLMSIGFYASAPIYDPDGVMVGRLCVFDLAPKQLGPAQVRALHAVAEDFTRIIELHLRRHADSWTRLEVSDEVLRIAAQIGHDMRTPLSALLTSLEMLAESEPGHDPIRARILGNARRSTRRLAGMVDGIMRLNNVARELDLAPVDLQRTAEQVVHDLAGPIADTGAAVHLMDLPIVLADADQMYSVLLNLVSNAVKFRRPDVGPLVTLTSRPTVGGWRILVSDNGVGVPEHRRDEIFTMFTRLVPSADGHGIGLATVARIVHAHHGRVGVEDSPAGGATIWFELPAGRFA